MCVWVQHILDEHMTCLPLAEVEIDCEWGHVITKAAVVRNKCDSNSQSVEKKKLNRTEQMKRLKRKEMKLEENLAEAIKNLLPLFTEEKDTMSLININTDEFIEAQQKS
ncbi:hypothetical protein TNCV_1619811 [Trichonephila clavipes]|nr:hypothetical protein TNCV_1619811 [Trichonephila clavipes]